MRRTVFGIGVCVCLAACATAAMAQTVKAQIVKDPATDATITVTPKAKPKEGKSGAKVTLGSNEGHMFLNAVAGPSPEYLEERAKQLEVEAKSLEAQAATMRAGSKRSQTFSIMFNTTQSFAQIADQLLTKWKKAPESEREAIQKELRDVVTKEYQQRLGTYSKEIEALEAQMKELREKLEFRKSKQDDIVDFRVQQLLREAQGLGWGTEPNRPILRGSVSVESDNPFVRQPAAVSSSSSMTIQDKEHP
jgi:ABC-type transporter MlaC component